LPPIVAALAIALPAGAAGSAATPLEREPGYVDSAPFLALATGDSELVEISVKGALLDALAQGFASEDAETSSLIARLKGINAVIVGLEHDSARTEKAQALVRDTARRLDQAGWERLARVREKDTDVAVFIRSGAKAIDGLVVLAFERGESKLVFANIVGVIDLAKIGEIGEKLDLPGMDQIPKNGKRPEKD
jgi:hypothetical protein